MKPVKNTLKLTLATASLVLIAGCSSPTFDAENENANRNRGAAGGALLGATMGVLVGEPDLAVKGAVAGGVAGGVAGSMKDLEDARQTQRTDTIAEGLKQDNRSDAERRAAELEAEIRIRELEQQLAEMDEAQSDEDSREG